MVVVEEMQCGGVWEAKLFFVDEAIDVCWYIERQKMTRVGASGVI